MKAYKGFDKNMKCRGFQYEEGGEYETDMAEVCESGFHACENPLNVLRFYPLRDGNRYCEVDQSGETQSDNCKTASTKIKIGAEIGLPGLVKAHFEYTRSKAESGKAGGNGSNLAGGDRSNLAGGNGSNLAGGDRSNLAGGNGSNLAGGNGSNLAGGNRSNLAGGYGSNLAGGNRSNLAGGNRSNLAGGDYSLCVVRNGKAKGGRDSVLVLTSWDWRNDEYVCTCVKAIIIDGERYKADTWYALRNGEVVEVAE